MTDDQTPHTPYGDPDGWPHHPPTPTDDPSTNSERQWVCRQHHLASCTPTLSHLGSECGYRTPSPVLDSERPASDLIERLTEMVRLIDWRGSEARLRNLLTEAVIALEAADAHRCPAPERDDLAGRRAASRPDSIQFRLRQFTPHHPVASGRQAMLDAADALDVARWPDGTTPQAPTVDSVAVPVEALDRLIGCHRFFCKSSTTPCCPAGEWIAAAGVSSDR